MKKLFVLIAVASLAIGCTKKQDQLSDSSNANASRLQEFYDQIMNAHNVDLIDSFVTSDFLDHQAMPGYPPGAEGLKASFKDFFTAFPDLKIKTNFTKAWGDTVMAHFTMSGTHTGTFMGMPATNKQFNVEGIDVVVIKNGKATEHWGYQEESKMMAQLGMGPQADSTQTVNAVK